MIEYNLEAELKKCIKSMHSGYIPKKDADHIRGVMERCLKWITDPMPPAEPDKRIAKIEDLVEGTIDHFDLDDAMDLLYQIKGVLK